MNTHVYLFTEQAIGATYGIGSYLSLLLETLRGEADFKVTVVELLSDKEETEEVFQDGIRYLYIPKANNGLKKNYYRNVFYTLHGYVNSEEKNIFHMNFMSCRKLAAILKAYYPQSLVLLTVHYSVCALEGVASEEIMNDEKEFMEYCDVVITLSAHRYRFLIEQYGIPPEKIKIIPHGIKDTCKVCQKQPPQRKLREILYVGRLDENKGADLLIEAFGLIEKLVPDLRLVVAGEGSLLPALLQKCKGYWDKVLFTGFLKREELEEWYSRATVGVIPSRYEEMGFVALEMMMHGLPIVANNTTGLADLLRFAEAGTLISLNLQDKGTATEQLATAIVNLVNNKELLRHYGESARKCYLEKYTFGRFKEDMLAIYRK